MSDYLFGKGIENEVEVSKDGTWIIWVHSDEKLKDAEHILKIYTQNPDLPEYQITSGHAAQHREMKKKADEEFQRKVYDRDRILAVQSQTGLLSGAMIALCVIVYVLCLFGYREQMLQALAIERFGDDFHPTERLPEIFNGEIWRLITPIFMHSTPLPFHILFNMLLFKDFASAIEKHHGSPFLAVLITVIATSSNLAQYFWHGPAFYGMSGVVYGLLGYIWMQSRYNPSSGFYVSRQLLNLAIAWFFLCLSGLVGPVANMAHGIGLLTGMAFGYIAAFLSVERRHD